jgi:hypothetical protein
MHVSFCCRSAHVTTSALVLGWPCNTLHTSCGLLLIQPCDEITKTSSCNTTFGSCMHSCSHGLYVGNAAVASTPPVESCPTTIADAESRAQNLSESTLRRQYEVLESSPSVPDEPHSTPIHRKRVRWANLRVARRSISQCRMCCLSSNASTDVAGVPSRLCPISSGQHVGRVFT